MAIPYNSDISIENYRSGYIPTASERTPSFKTESAIRQIFIRGEQCIRDAARMVLKEPIRCVWTPIVLPKNWKRREHLKINAQLAAISFTQLVAVSVKPVVVLIDYVFQKSISEKIESCTTYLDGRAAQLEALKEEGCSKANTWEEYQNYQKWLFQIDPALCLETVRK
jgi:hypothetical protein